MRHFLFYSAVLIVPYAIFWGSKLYVGNSEPLPLILVYHDIREADEKTGSSEFVTPAVFEQQMAYLSKNGFMATSLEDHASDNKAGWRNVVLAFDDTWKSQYEAALPILQKYGFGATFYINSDWVGKSPFMTWDNVRSIAADSLMEVGGHTKTHPHLLGVGAEAIEKEITEDKRTIEKEIERAIYSFAYPYGEHDDIIVSVVKKAGYGTARAANIMEAPDKLLLPAVIAPNTLEGFIKEVTRINYDDERKYWNNTISHLGPQGAYSLLKQHYAHAPHNIAHNTAHVFGEVLYEKGVEGIAVCDISFIFGCYHGFLGRAISEEGVDVLAKLDAACNKKGREWLGCHHGIGHGLMSYFGDAKLEEALFACTSLSWKGPVGGCYGGLFMEYNFRNAHFEGDGLEYTRPNSGGLFEPCVYLPEKFRSACFYEQPDWWRRIFGEDYKKLGELCGKVDDQADREFCFIGVGRMAAQSKKYNIEETILECARIDSERNVSLCRAGGFLSIFDSTGLRSDLSICNGLTLEYSSLCLEKAQMFMR